MKLWVKILLVIGIIFLVLIAALLAVAYYTYKQVKEVIVIIQDPSLREDMVSLMENRDCSKLSSVELKLNEIELKVTSACSNPIIKFISSSEQAKQQTQGVDLCLATQDLKNQTKQLIDTSKNYCNNLTAIISS